MPHQRISPSRENFAHYLAALGRTKDNCYHWPASASTHEPEYYKSKVSLENVHIVCSELDRKKEKTQAWLRRVVPAHISVTLLAMGYNRLMNCQSVSHQSHEPLLNKNMNQGKTGLRVMACD